MAIWLVVWNMFDFSIHWEQSLTIIPTDFHIFQRGRYTTNQLCFWLNICLWSVSHLDFYVVQRRFAELRCRASRFALPRWCCLRRSGLRNCHLVSWVGISRMGRRRCPKFMAHFCKAEWWQNDESPSLWHIVAIFWWLNDGRMVIDDGIRMYILRWTWWSTVSTVSTVSNCQAPYFQADPKWN